VDRHQLANLSPPDAVVALRSYGRRFRELFGAAEPAGEQLPLTTAVWQGWSVSARLAAAGAHLARLDAALGEVTTLDSPQLPSDLYERPGPAAGGPAEATALLDQLLAATTALADRVARTPAKDWSRPATVDGRPTAAHELLQEAVAYGRTALDELAAVLDAARRAAN